MSASQQKRQRQQEREQGTEKHQLAQKKIEKISKRHQTTRSVISIIVVVILLVVIVISSNLLYTNFTAVKVGNDSYTAAEYSFIYNYGISSFENQYSSYLSALGLDTTKPLDEQKYGGDETKTWADYFKESAQTSLQQMSAFYDAAQDAGFKLSDDDQASLDTNLEGLKTCYQGSDYSNADAYLSHVYGKGVTEEVVGSIITKSAIATAYSTEKEASFTYTSDQMKDYYSQNKDDLDNYTYISYTVDGSVKDSSTGSDSSADTAGSASSTDITASPSSTDAASPSPSADTDAAKAAAMANAKSIADSIVSAGTSEDAFKAAVTAQSKTETTESNTEGKSLSSDYADWMKDASRVKGDTTVIASDSGYYALYFVGRDDNNYYTVNVRHILIDATASSDGTYSDDAKAAAKQKAEDLLAQWKAGDATENSFADLANANSQDTGSNTKGGLYENVQKGQMVANFNDWCFDPSRKPGDTGIVYGESSSYSGYHIMYYVGQGELNADKLAESALRDKDFSDWKTALFDKYGTKEGLTAGLVKQVTA